MAPTIDRLMPFDKRGALRIVVETPRGSCLKLSYEPSLKAFTVSRALPLGVTYPFDWGFIPGTLADDGDPVDALVLHEGATYPGVILACKLLGMVHVTQRRKSGKPGRIENNRVIALPLWNDRLGQIAETCDLPDQLKREIEQFFLNATYFTGKEPRIEGWTDAAPAKRFVERLLSN